MKGIVKKMIYLDNAATTKPSENAVKAVVNAMEEFGNPSSLHGLGIKSEKIIESSREAVAKRLGVRKKDIYFTSGGTEANNTAIFGTALNLRKRGNHLITSSIEHPSVLEAFKELEKNGFEVSYINPDENGVINVEKITEAMREDTILVSVMSVNNETGIVQPVKEISDIVHSKSSVAVVHSDCVQAFCKTDCIQKKLGADIISVSSHKIHGPKGVGALYIGSSRIKPLLYGGEQQGRIRPGTENVPGIAGFGAAVSEEYGNCDILYDTLKNEILSEIDDVKINGDEKFSSKYILNVSFRKIKAEILLHSLEARGIYASTGSACSSHKPDPSHVLLAMGVDRKDIDGSLRFSFDSSLTEADMKNTAAVLKEEVAKIRKYVR